MKLRPSLGHTAWARRGEGALVGGEQAPRQPFAPCSALLLGVLFLSQRPAGPTHCADAVDRALSPARPALQLKQLLTWGGGWSPPCLGPSPGSHLCREDPQVTPAGVHPMSQGTSSGSSGPHFLICPPISQGGLSILYPSLGSGCWVTKTSHTVS